MNAGDPVVASVNVKSWPVKSEIVKPFILGIPEPTKPKFSSVMLKRGRLFDHR
jgi:hypothetical protein